MKTSKVKTTNIYYIYNNNNFQLFRNRLFTKYFFCRLTRLPIGAYQARQPNTQRQY